MSSRIMKMLPLYILNLFIMQPGLGIASDTGYEVEIIIFEDATGRYENSEDWSYNDMLNNRESNNLDSNPEPDSEFKELEWGDSSLNDSLERIKSNDNYNILVNKRWKQTGLDRDAAYSIYVSSYEPVTSHSNEISSSDTITEVSATPDSYINGEVKLVMSRYLHFEVNLMYHKKIIESDMSTEQYVSYPVVAERRMRSREIHYLDHPMIGVIVYTVPYEIPTEIEKKSQ